MSEKTPPHADPSNPSIAAILAFDLDNHVAHDAIAAALRPHVLDAPPLREWSEDDEWTAAEEAVAAASAFVDGVTNPEGDDPWLRNQDRLDRLRRMQGAHRRHLVLERLGEFPGYQIRVDDWWPIGVRIRVWEAGVSTDLSPWILALDTETTRREVQIAIAAWKAGYDAGSAHGAARIRDGIRDLLQIEAA